MRRTPEYRAGYKSGVRAGKKKENEDVFIRLHAAARDSLIDIVRDVNQRSGISPLMWNDPVEHEKIMSTWTSHIHAWLDLEAELLRRSKAKE